jgi:hypothetical protein
MRNLPFSEAKNPEGSACYHCVRCGLCLAVFPQYREYLIGIIPLTSLVALSSKCLELERKLILNLIEQRKIEGGMIERSDRIDGRKRVPCVRANFSEFPGWLTQAFMCPQIV